MKSQKTTWAGLAMAIGVALFAWGMDNDADAETVGDWAAVQKYAGAAMLSLGSLLNGLFSRDNSVTSEQAGAK
jgi:hypothetical protein